MQVPVITQKENSSFSSLIPNLQLAWDSTSLGLIMECPRKYFYTMIRGRQTRGENVHFTFGGHYHKALEVYDHARSSGASYEDGLDAAVAYCLEATVDRVGDSWRPWQSDDQNKNRATLLRTVIWYLCQFENDSLRTVQLSNGKPAVELSFRYQINETNAQGEPFILCGHIDRLVEQEDGSIMVLDRKTTKTTIYSESIQKFKLSSQMQGYDFSANVVWAVPVSGIIIDMAQVMVTFSRFLRGPIHFKEDQREEWYRDVVFFIRQAEFFAQNSYWPMNRASCGNYGGCPFAEICSKPPSTRDLWFNQMTKPRKWDPLQVRGDI